MSFFPSSIPSRAPRYTYLSCLLNLLWYLLTSQPLLVFHDLESWRACWPGILQTVPQFEFVWCILSHGSTGFGGRAQKWGARLITSCQVHTRSAWFIAREVDLEHQPNLVFAGILFCKVTFLPSSALVFGSQSLWCSPHSRAGLDGIKLLL